MQRPCATLPPYAADAAGTGGASCRRRHELQRPPAMFHEMKASVEKMKAPVEKMLSTLESRRAISLRR